MTDLEVMFSGSRKARGAATGGGGRRRGRTTRQANGDRVTIQSIPGNSRGARLARARLRRQ